MEIYNASDKQNKTMITKKIVDALKESGRFLKSEGAAWVEVSDKAARLKVSSSKKFADDDSRFFTHIQI
jgi:rRNA-processing protein FCF1